MGEVAQQAVLHRLKDLWSNISEQNVLSLGYGVPYLGSFCGKAKRVHGGAMPAAQGVSRWPQHAPGLTALVDEIELSFPDLSIDRVLLIHALECSEQIHPLLREIWRVLSGSGRLIVVAPNRRGLWTQFERTPFGHKQPFSSPQLSKLLHDNLFTPIKTHPVLLVPLVYSPMILSSAAACGKE